MLTQLGAHSEQLIVKISWHSLHGTCCLSDQKLLVMPLDNDNHGFSQMSETPVIRLQRQYNRGVGPRHLPYALCKHTQQPHVFSGY